MQNKQDRVYQVLFWFTLSVGLFLRCYQYFINRSLWHDEAHLALNFIYSDFEGLTKPLEHYQTAPILFLWGVEACSRIFGFGEMALRFFPFIISIITFPLFYYFVLALTKNKTVSTISFFIYAVNLSFVYYASELKPYTIDTSAFVTLGYLCVSSNRFVEKNRFIFLVIAGALLVFLSNATPVVFACCILYFIRKRYSVLEIQLKHVYIILSWSLFFFMNYMIFIQDHPYAGGMKEIWSYTFMPKPFSGPDFNRYVSEYIPNVFLSDIFLLDRSYYLGYTFTLLGIIGIIKTLHNKQYDTLIFCLLPFIATLCMSAMKMYPFYYRFVLYSAAGLILLISIGLDSIITTPKSKVYRIFGSIAVIFLVLFISKNSILKFPKWEIRIKPSLAYINDNYKNQTVLVTTPATMLEYYSRTGYVHIKEFKKLNWDLDADAFLNDEIVKQQKHNYLVLHGAKGGDNSNIFIPELKRRGLIVKEFTNNDFTVTELKPAQQ